MNRLRFWGLGALAAAAAAGAAGSRWTPWPAPLGSGIVLAFVLTALSYLALSAALHRSNAVFFGVFAGGLFFRMSALLAAVLAVHRAREGATAPFAVAAAAGLMGFTVIELIFLNGQNQKWTSSTRSSTTSSTTPPSA